MEKTIYAILHWFNSIYSSEIHLIFLHTFDFVHAHSTYIQIQRRHSQTLTTACIYDNRDVNE